MRCTNVFIGIWWPMEPLGFGEVSSFRSSFKVQEKFHRLGVGSISSSCNGSSRYNHGQFLAFMIIFNTLRQSHRGNHVEIGLELDEPELEKGLREDICELVLGGDVINFNFADVDVFSNKIEIYFDVLHSSMEYWISC